MESIKTSVIILNYNTKEVTVNCVQSLLKNTKSINYEIILIDNGSTDGSVEKFKQKFGSRIKLVINKKNMGFAGANNQGIKKAKGEYILLLNSDTLVNSNVLSEMALWMNKHKEVGVSSCMLKNADGSVQGTGGYFPNMLRVISWMTIEDIPFVDYFIKPFHPLRVRSFYKNSKFYNKEREMDWLTGAFLLIRRKAVDDIGLIDEDYFMYTEDVDFCFRAKHAGWKIMYLPKWSIVHLGGASSTSEYPVISEFKGIKLFYKKHYPAWQYPILRFFLKVGALLRMVFFGIIYRKEISKSYAKAFMVA